MRNVIVTRAALPVLWIRKMTRGMKDDRREQIVRRSALKLLVAVEDVANAAKFLLSDGAKSVTGTVMTVDAGSTA